jgi:hypothetical protein
MSEKANDRETAERHRIRDRILQELAIAGLPAYASSLGRPHRDVGGFRVNCCDGSPPDRHVTVRWQCSEQLHQRALAALADRRTEAPMIRHAETVKEAMNAAVHRILTAAGFTLADNPDNPEDPSPPSWRISAAPGAETPLAWELGHVVGAGPDRDQLARLWADHLAAPFPDAFRDGREFADVDMVLLDANIAGCISTAMKKPLEDKHLRALRGELELFPAVLPLVDDDEGLAHLTRLRTLAETAIAVNHGGNT